MEPEVTMGPRMTAVKRMLRVSVILLPAITIITVSTQTPAVMPGSRVCAGGNSDETRIISRNFNVIDLQKVIINIKAVLFSYTEEFVFYMYLNTHTIGQFQRT